MSDFDGTPNSLKGLTDLTALNFYEKVLRVRTPVYLLGGHRFEIYEISLGQCTCIALPSLLRRTSRLEYRSAASDRVLDTPFARSRASRAPPQIRRETPCTGNEPSERHQIATDAPRFTLFTRCPEPTLAASSSTGFTPASPEPPCAAPPSCLSADPPRTTCSLPRHRKNRKAENIFT